MVGKNAREASVADENDPRRTEFVCNIKRGSLGDLPDGGHKVTLHLPETELDAAMRLYVLKDMALRCVLVPEDILS